MPIFKYTQVINHAVDEVFNTVIDIANFPKWNPTVTEAKKISKGETGEGSKFEMKIKGFGWVPQTLAEFSKNKRVVIVPQMKMMNGGHRFIFTQQGNNTRIDHELIMNPVGLFILMTPMLKMTGKKNLHDTANALQKYLEGI
jgi:ribosome-associated toxin RatA of RatAB toxin-antitoxin module